MNFFPLSLLPPATKLGQGYVFTRVCDSVHRGGMVTGVGACVVAGGACVVAGGGGVVAGGVGCAWLWGGHAWLPGGHGLQGACLVAREHVWLPGGMCGCQGGMHGHRGSCMVARGHAWLLGGMCGCRGACMVARGCAWLLGGGGVHGWQGGMCRIRRDTVNERPVRILLECILVICCTSTV